MADCLDDWAPNKGYDIKLMVLIIEGRYSVHLSLSAKLGRC